MKKKITRYMIFHYGGEWWWQDHRWKRLDDVDRTRPFSSHAQTRTKASARRVADKSPAKTIHVVMRSSRRGGYELEWELTRPV